jgi:16S rRNA (guanine(966)-N(2))-methyltransferase RsmD
MRIIAGTLRGRTLRGPRGLAIRPTGDRLKQTLFDILGARMPDSIFLDVFAGTGSIGIEAISRGAREVVFIESGAEALRLVRQNLELCGIEEGYRLLREDVFPALRRLAREGFAPDTAYFDPPYDWKPYRDLLDLLFHPRMTASAVGVIEHLRKSPVPESGKRYTRFRTVVQGDKCLSFYRIADSRPLAGV